MVQNQETDDRKTESLKSERQEKETQKKECFPSLDGRLTRRKIMRQNRSNNIHSGQHNGTDWYFLNFLNEAKAIN